MNGVLVVNKGRDVTSRDVVNDLVHIFHTKKIGHTGTLDPLATGVLVCTIGKYTKLNLDLTSEYKEYVAGMRFGILTDTLDITGNVLKEEDIKLDKELITKTINSFQKEYDQEVPIYSSVKVNGRKLYDYARNGESVELPVRKVNIKNIEILSIDGNDVKFRCLVSKGTYIRSLIRDIGESLNTCATMTSLERTKQGKFDIKDSYTIDDIKNNKYKILSLEEVLDLDIVTASDNLFKLIDNGVTIEYKYNKDYILFRYSFNDIALYKKEEDKKYHMYIKLNN